MSKKISKGIRKEVSDRANGYCEYCYALSDYSPNTFSIDHIIPQSLEGNHDISNLALSCTNCNNHKYNKIEHFDAITNQNIPLFHPRTDYWLNHFQWSSDGQLIMGLTSKGRVTVELLRLNRQSNINLRELLLLVGLHPPNLYPAD